MHITFYPQASGGGPAAQDRFWPRYLVGNVPAGDSPVAYSVAGFDYIPDLGNGAGIAAALALAVADPGVVGVRRGSYDLNAAGAPVVPFSVPAGTIVQGMGPYIVGLNQPTGQIIARDEGDQGVFSIDGNGAQVRDIMIIVPESPQGAVFAGSNYLCRLGPDGSGGFENVVILSFGLPTDSLIRRFFSAENSNTASFLRCYALHFTPSRLGADPADWLSAFYVGQPTALLCDIQMCASVGQDVSVFSATLSSIIKVSAHSCLGFARRGIYQSPATPGVVTCGNGSFFVATDVNSIGVELTPGTAASNYGSSLQDSALIGVVGDMLGAALHIHGAPGGAGFVRVLGDFFLWQRDQAGAVVEIGDTGVADPCDRNLINDNQISSNGSAANGVAVLDAANTSNSIQINSILVGGAQTADAGTLTQIAGNV